jgi:glycosyltransferase involved in cell wall biosynthesis
MRAASVTVVMPTFNRSAFLGRAIDSLFAQHFADWQLVLVDDGSDDDTPAVLAAFQTDPRVTLHRFERNRGLGAALNTGLDDAVADLIAYLPSDDVYHPEHLGALMSRLEAEPGAVLAFSGVRHHYDRSSIGAPDDGWLQLVQVMHRRTPDRWLERSELVTDNLDWMLWNALRARGDAVGTGRVSCEWTDHPDQLHKLLQEPVGGLNLYRQRFAVDHPLRFHTSVGNCIDEVSRYGAFRGPRPPASKHPLRIVLAGELAYNAERVVAFEERGHELHGLWMPAPYWQNTVGPLPFGHVRDLPAAGWQGALRALRPDIVYALLNWQAVPFCREVQRVAREADIPFVWHLKEGPFICLERGTWPTLVDLQTKSDGVMHSSDETCSWFEQAIHVMRGRRHQMVLDGDLPKRQWFPGRRSPRLGRRDGSVHTVIAGRPIGLPPSTIESLARHDIHVHFYGDFTQGQSKAWIERAKGLAPSHLHLHEQVDQDRWGEEFSRYDAGWLHVFRSENGGELRRATCNDLILPTRLATYAAAGLPTIQIDNTGSLVAAQRLAREHDSGVFFSDVADLAAQLRDCSRMSRLRANAWRHRDRFTFDAHADRLIAFFREVIADT